MQQVDRGAVAAVVVRGDY
jgi:hypothetical protein